jgi:hypothetical protein
MLISPLHSIANTIGRTYAFTQGTNKHALPMTITTCVEVRFLGSIFVVVFIVDFANATRVLMCQSNRGKLESMKNEPNNTHLPYMTTLFAGELWELR